MKTSHPCNVSTLTVLIAALSFQVCQRVVLAQKEPSPAPPPQATPAQVPLDEQATTEAMAAFKAGHNDTAIAKADECISRYRAAADRIQSILETNKIILPKGKVSAADKKRIARYQILHNVATCFLVKGWAEDKLGNSEAARRAYVEASRYTYARVCDPKTGQFWSPAEVATERLTPPSHTPPDAPER